MNTRAARFADLHSHVVPGVDDGSRSLLESLGALRAFRDEGVGLVAVTPHLYLPHHDGALALRRRVDELRGAYELLRNVTAGRLGMPTVLFGQEVCAPDADAVRRVVDDPAVGLAGTSFLLVEFGFGLNGDPEGVIRAVRAAGREILVAHPERYRFPEDADPVDVVRRWRELGAYMQVNLGSLQEHGGPYGAGVERLAWRLLEEGLAHVVSSDHHSEARPQIHHRAVFQRLAAHGGGGVAESLLGENPRRVLLGRLPEEVGPLGVAAVA